jgi:hypothetical protein
VEVSSRDAGDFGWKVLNGPVGGDPERERWRKS